MAAADTAELLWYPAARDTLEPEGIARYRPGTDEVAGFLPIHVAAIHTTVLRGRASLPRGSLVVCATRRQVLRPKADALFLLGPDLSVIDSIPLPPPQFEAYDVAITSDERFAYVKSPPLLLKVDLTARRVVAQATSVNLGSLVLSSAGDLLIETDPGVGLDTPSSGKIRLYSPDLVPLGTVDLRPLSPGNLPPTTWDCAVSADGKLAFVVAGTPRGTLGQGVQSASLFVIDLARREAIARVALDEYGAGRVFVIR